MEGYGATQGVRVEGLLTCLTLHTLAFITVAEFGIMWQEENESREE